MVIGEKLFCIVIVSLACFGCASPPDVAEGESSKPTPTPTQAVVRATPTPAVTPTPSPTPSPTMEPVERKRSLLNLFMEGSILEEEGNDSEAADLYLEGLEMAPDSRYLRVLAGEALRRSGRVDEASVIAQDLITSSTPTADEYRLLGHIYQEQNKYAEAIGAFQKALAREPADVETRLELVNLYLLTNQDEEVVEQFQRLAELDPAREAEYRFQAANRLIAMDRVDEALTQFERLAELIGNYFEVHLRIGDLHTVQGNLDQAIEAYLTALSNIEEPAQEAEIRRRLGAIYQQRGSLQEAIYQYTRILEINPRNSDARQSLVSLYINQDDYEKALEEINFLEGRAADPFRIQMIKRSLLERLNRNEDSLSEFLDGFRTVSAAKNQEALRRFAIELGSASELEDYQSAGKLDALATAIDQAKQENPNNPSLWFARARLAKFRDQSSRLDRELQFIEERLAETQSEGLSSRIEAIARSFIEWYPVRYAFTENDRAQPIIAMLSQAHEAMPDAPHVARALGLLLVDQRAWSRAESVFERAVGLTEPGSNAWRAVQYQRAIVYEELGRIADVERVIRAVIEAFPDDANAYNFLGYTYADHDMNLDEALELVQTALSRSPEDGNIVDSLGWVYFRMGRYAKAVETLEQANRLQPGNPVILDHLGDAYQQVGEPEKAVATWREALEAGPNFPQEFTPAFRQAVQEKIDSIQSGQ